MSAQDKVVGRLSTLDRYLPLWIFAAMALGLGLGRAWPGIGAALDRVKLDSVSLPIAIGLLWMMYPVLAKVKYGQLGHLGARGKLLGTSLVFNWVIGPLLMFGLAIYFGITFVSAFLVSRRLGFNYEETAALSFTAAGNNFELAIAVAVGLFGIQSGEARAGVVGPLIEVPALVALVYLSLWLRRRLFREPLPEAVTVSA